MAFDLTNFHDPALDEAYLTHLVDQQASETATHYARLWNYFLNPFVPPVGVQAGAINERSRPYFQAQEAGLPARITGVARTGLPGGATTDFHRKEVVIENDIAWRLHTMVDFLFGKGVTIRSLAADPFVAQTVEAVAAALLDANGGLRLLQEIALLGAVHGFADVALRAPRSDAARAASPGRPSPPSENRQDPNPDRSRTRTARAVHAVRRLMLETVEAGRVLPILDEDDYQTVRFWIQRYDKHPSRMVNQRRPWYAFARRPSSTPAAVEVVEILSSAWWQRYEDRELVAEGPCSLGRLPVVHIQNVALPGSYSGLSDVEPLIALQDELNTRLSDRASRVTFQSFRMYLGKGIDNFLERPVAPGQMWATHNPDAEIQEFGSDPGSPSEDVHIEQVRQAMDKVSGVTPLAAGLIRGHVGNLTSAAALRVVLSGLLARTAKKRLTYGAGLRQIISVALDFLDRTGALRTAPEDRRVEIHWPALLPDDEGEQLRNALTKVQLGVPADRVLAEIGYANEDADVR